MKYSKNITIIAALLVACWCAGILAAPVLLSAGDHSSAHALYAFYGRVCHQDDARSFHCAGEKFGVCIRCTAIYFSFLAATLLLLFRMPKRYDERTLRRTIIVAALPMIIDALLDVSGLHASTTLTRIVSGAVFGGVMPWILFPLFLEALRQLRRTQPFIHQNPENRV